MEKKRIIFVSGLLIGNSIYKNVNLWLNDLFPKHEIILLCYYYNYFQIEEMHILKNKLVNLIEDEKETILIGHSFGSIIINSAINNSKTHNVNHIISLFSPHKLNYFGMKKRKKLLDYSEINDNNIFVKSFGAYFDILVPFFLSKQKNSIHKNYFTDHQIRLFKSEIFFKKIILEGMKK